MKISHTQTRADDIARLIAKAKAEGRNIRIKGYASASSGTVIDYVLKPEGPSLYGELLRANLALLEAGKFESPKHPPEAVKAAVADQLASVQKSLTGLSSNTGGGGFGKTKDIGDNAAFAIGDEGIVTLRNMRVIEAQVISGTKAATTHKNELTAAKAWLRESLPTSKFSNSLILNEGKYEYIEIV